MKHTLRPFERKFWNVAISWFPCQQKWSPLINKISAEGYVAPSGPMRQYFSLYRAVSQREEKEERKDR